MFGNGPDLGEQALSKAAELGISAVLNEAESIEVDIRTDGFKLMQGELESVRIEGEGLVMKQDLRAEELTLEIDQVGINPLKAAFGEIEFTRPSEATAEMVLNEQDIERAFNSDFIRNKLQNLPVEINGQPVHLNVRSIHFSLPDTQKIALKAEVERQDTKTIEQAAFTAVPTIDANGQRLKLAQVEYDNGAEISPELTTAILDSASDLLDLRNFDMKGVSIKLTQLAIAAGKLTFQGEAIVEQFPG
ncbi:MAG: DUF2993 domain-containing protein [Leptolyngbyaceae cyanobacterium SM1_3_5]|nr:DUF2993 domain-containing protein [Leptolyngbyaceae cyanobacterium SM1_3_5]